MVVFHNREHSIMCWSLSSNQLRGYERRCCHGKCIGHFGPDPRHDPGASSSLTRVGGSSQGAACEEAKFLAIQENQPDKPTKNVTALNKNMKRMIEAVVGERVGGFEWQSNQSLTQYMDLLKLDGVYCKVFCPCS